MKKIEILEVGLKTMFENPNILYSYWFLTGNCNYKCDYCDVFRNEKLANWETKQKIIEFLNHMDTIRDQKILLYGGEPTCDSDFLTIARQLNSYIRLFTNLSNSLDFFKSLLLIRTDMTISISYHIYKVNKSEFLEKLQYLLDSDVKKIRMKIMADSRRKKQSIEEYEFFKQFESREGYECYIDLVLPNQIGSIGADWCEDDLSWFLPLQDYETLHLKYVDNSGKETVRDVSWNEMRTTMLESNNYYKCGAGKNLIFVDSNADVFPCKSHTTPILNLVKEDFHDYLDHFEDGMICDFMGFCCETDFPKTLVLRRKSDVPNKNIKSRLHHADRGEKFVLFPLGHNKSL